MWRESPKGYFERLYFDSPNVKGISGIKLNTNFRIKHLGYINKDLVDKKAELYSGLIDPKKKASLRNMYLQNEKNW